MERRKVLILAIKVQILVPDSGPVAQLVKCVFLSRKSISVQVRSGSFVFRGSRLMVWHQFCTLDLTSSILVYSIRPVSLMVKNEGLSIP